MQMIKPLKNPLPSFSLLLSLKLVLSIIGTIGSNALSSFFLGSLIKPNFWVFIASGGHQRAERESKPWDCAHRKGISVRQSVNVLQGKAKKKRECLSCL